MQFSSSSKMFIFKKYAQFLIQVFLLDIKKTFERVHLDANINQVSLATLWNWNSRTVITLMLTLVWVCLSECHTNGLQGHRQQCAWITDSTITFQLKFSWVWKRLELFFLPYTQIERNPSKLINVKFVFYICWGNF